MIPGMYNPAARTPKFPESNTAADTAAMPAQEMVCFRPGIVWTASCHAAAMSEGGNDLQGGLAAEIW